MHIMPSYHRPGPEPGLRSSSLLYDVSTGAPGQPFELLVTRRATKEPLFDTRGTRCGHYHALQSQLVGIVKYRGVVAVGIEAG
jgi:hypothetical protein